MCKFCESIINKSRNIEWFQRSRYADDNFCEKVLKDNCSNCKECTETFELDGWMSEGNMFLINKYERTNGDIKIHSSSESLHINYCPYCGKQVSKDIIDFDDMYQNVIEVYNLDGSTYDYEMDKFIESLNNK